MRKAAHFDDAITVACRLGAEPLPKRIAAAKELLLALDASQDITATALFEDGRVVVKATLGGTDVWRVDFHLVWPEPQLNNQHLSVFKLINWSAAAPARAAANESSAANARSRAEAKLRDAIADLTTAGRPLEGRVTLIEAPGS